MSDIVFKLSILGTVLFMIIFSLRFLIKSVSPSCLYFLWIVVMLRFLIPIFPTFEIPSFMGAKIGNLAKGDIVLNESNLEFLYNNSLNQANFNLEFSINYYISAIWFIGFFIALALNLCALIKLNLNFKQNQVILTDPSVYKAFKECKQNLKIKREIKLFSNIKISSPVLIGILKPIICIPSHTNLKSLNYIFSHELIHYKRFDLLIKQLMNLVVCINWFNPFVYILRKELNKSCEMSCDISVIRNMDLNDREVYGNIILDIAKNGSYMKSLFVSSLYEDKYILKERLNKIMNYKKSTFKKRISMIIICVAICIIAIFSGSVFAENKTTYPENIKIQESYGLQFTIKEVKNDNEYTNIEYEIESDFDFDLGQDITIIKVINDNQSTDKKNLTAKKTDKTKYQGSYSIATAELKTEIEADKTYHIKGENLMYYISDENENNKENSGCTTITIP